MFVEPHSSTPMRGLWSEEGPRQLASSTLDDERGTSTVLTPSSSSATVNMDSSNSAELVYRLIHAVENTRHSPDLLPYPQQVVDRISALVVAQTEQVEQLVTAERQEQEEARLMGVTHFLPFKRSDMMKFEIQRVQFLLCELLRSRLRLIEQLCFLIQHEMHTQQQHDPPLSALGSGPYSGFLSQNELAIALRLAKMKHACMMANGLRNVPEPLQMLTPNLPHGEGLEILPIVEVGKHVFVYFLEDIPGPVELARDVSETMSRGEIFLVPFASLRNFVVDGKARLI